MPGRTMAAMNSVCVWCTDCFYDDDSDDDDVGKEAGDGGDHVNDSNIVQTIVPVPVPFVVVSFALLLL